MGCLTATVGQTGKEKCEMKVIYNKATGEKEMWPKNRAEADLMISLLNIGGAMMLCLMQDMSQTQNGSGGVYFRIVE